MDHRFARSRAIRALGLGALGVSLCLPACKTDARCQKDCMCHLKGWCGASFGQCEATEDAHCKASEVCRINGLCKADKGMCVAGTDEGCAASRVCLHLGACKAVDGRCK